MTKKLPSEEILIRQIVLTCELIWKNNQFTRSDLEIWLSNFKGEAFSQDYERRLALWLLSNFVYYNEDEVKHLCKLLYRDFLHSMILKYSTEALHDALNRITNSCKFYSLGRPGESSGFLLYYFRQENSLPVDKFISDPRNLSSDVRHIVFVDDVLLTGSQAQKYLEKAKAIFSPDKDFIILSFISTKQAIDLLSSSNVKVIASIVLDDRSKCFSESSGIFHQHKEHKEPAKQFAEHYGRKINPNPLGYGDGQYTFGFFYNTPDNTLPIFWSENSGWKPIVKRYHKKYSGDVIYDFGPFI